MINFAHYQDQLTAMQARHASEFKELCEQLSDAQQEEIWKLNNEIDKLRNEKIKDGKK